MMGLEDLYRMYYLYLDAEAQLRYEAGRISRTELLEACGR